MSKPSKFWRNMLLWSPVWLALEFCTFGVINSTTSSSGATIKADTLPPWKICETDPEYCQALPALPVFEETIEEETKALREPLLPKDFKGYAYVNGKGEVVATSSFSKIKLDRIAAGESYFGDDKNYTVDGYFLHPDIANELPNDLVLESKVGLASNYFANTYDRRYYAVRSKDQCGIINNYGTWVVKLDDYTHCGIVKGRQFQSNFAVVELEDHVEIHSIFPKFSRAVWEMSKEEYLNVELDRSEKDVLVVAKNGGLYLYQDGAYLNEEPFEFSHKYASLVAFEKNWMYYDAKNIGINYNGQFIKSTSRIEGRLRYDDLFQNSAQIDYIFYNERGKPIEEPDLLYKRNVVEGWRLTEKPGGYVNAQGEWFKLKPPHEDFNTPSRFGNIYAPIHPDPVEQFSDGYLPVMIGYKFGFAIESGEVVIPPQFFGVRQGFQHGFAIVEEPHNVLGVINETGEWVIAPSQLEGRPYIRILNDDVILLKY